MHYSVLRHLLYIVLLTIGLTVTTGIDTRAQSARTKFSPKMLVYENLDNETVLLHFKQRFTQLDSLLSSAGTVSLPVVRLQALMRHSASGLTDSLYAAKTAHEALALKRNTGLEITGQIYARPEEALKPDRDEDDVSVYKAKAQAEVGWNIINSKYYHGQQKYNDIKLNNELDRLQQQRHLNADIYDKAADLLTEQVNQYIGAVIAQRLENLDILNEAYQYMLERDRISNDKMIEVINDKMNAEYELSMISANVDLSKVHMCFIKPTLMVVDTTALWRAADMEGLDARISKVREDIATNKSSMTNYLSTTRLTPFVRWSSYWTSNNKFSNNADVGLRFTIPLYDESGRKKKALATEVEILRSGRDVDMAQKRTQCEVLLKRIANINRAINTENYHINQLQRYVDIRRNAYLHQKKGYNYLVRMEEYNEYLKSLERLYKLMLNRSLAMIEIQKAASLNATEGIFSEIEITD